MDIVTTAIVTGIILGTQKVGAQVVLDAYNRLKALLQQKLGVDNKLVDAVDQIEKEPDFEPYRHVLEGRVAELNAVEDTDIRLAAERVVQLADSLRQTDETVGVRLENVRFGSLTLLDIISSGTGVAVKDAHIEKDVHISGIRAGVRDSQRDPKA